MIGLSAQVALILLKHLPEMIEMVTVEAKLFVVATPIGNLGDWTDRAAKVISQVRWSRQRTRGQSKITRSFGLQPNLISLHEHNERHQSGLVDRLQSGNRVP